MKRALSIILFLFVHAETSPAAPGTPSGEKPREVGDHEVVAPKRASVPRASPAAPGSSTASGPQARREEISSPGGSGRANALSLEILGRGGLYSIAYDRLFLGSRLALGAGFSYVGLSLPRVARESFDARASVFPLYAHYYFSRAKHRPYVGAGVSLVTGRLKAEGLVNREVSGFESFYNLGGGYEFRGDGGFVFRIAPYLMSGFSNFLWLGTTLGYAF